MPLYSNTYPPSAVWPGGDVTIVNAEQLGAGNFSQRAAIAQERSGIQRAVTITFSYAGTPGAVVYDIYAAFDDNLANYAKIGSSNNVNGDQQTFNRNVAGGVDFRFIIVKEVTSPGVNATVKVRQ